MALTPSAFRLDLKCGKGAISEGEKCTKGPATKVKQGQLSPRQIERARSKLTKAPAFKKRYVAVAALGGLVAIGLY